MENTLSFQSEFGAIKSLFVKHARLAFRNEDVIDSQWEELGFYGRPDLERAIWEYDQLTSLLEGFGVDIHYLPLDASLTIDSLYPRDAAISCAHGMILCNMGKENRREEPAALGRLFQSLGISIHGQITGDGRIEGGDVAWIDERTLRLEEPLVFFA